MVAVEADLMNAQANLEMERERSSKQTQSAERIRRLLAQVEVGFVWLIDLIRIYLSHIRKPIKWTIIAAFLLSLDYDLLTA